MTEVKNGNGKSLYIAMIIVLLALNAWLFYNAQQNKKTTLQYQHQIYEVDSLNKDLELGFKNLIIELNTKKGESREKDSLINLLENDLQLKRNRINSLINSSTANNKPASIKQLKEAKELIAKLEADVNFYKTKVDEYSDLYNALLKDYNLLKNEYDLLVLNNAMLKAERDSILIIGSIIMAADIKVISLQEKRSGDKETDKAKKINKLKIDFDLVPNMLSAGRNQIFFFKLIDPNNIIMKSNDAMGGDFSAMVSVDYNGIHKESHTVYWEQNYTFLPGTYQIEMYHNGFEVGDKTFVLK